jgi:CheY-like chemotaxis protein
MKKFRVCIADDDQDDYDLIVSIFHDLGVEHSFTHAENGVQLINSLENDVANRQSLPDLILLDLNMPKMDGLQALEAIRSKKRLSAVPVLIYSTSSSSEQKEKCYALGADGFVTKESSMKKIIDFVIKLNGFLNNTCEMPGKKLSKKLQASAPKKNSHS